MRGPDRLLEVERLVGEEVTLNIEVERINTTLRFQEGWINDSIDEFMKGKFDGTKIQMNDLIF